MDARLKGKRNLICCFLIFFVLFFIGVFSLFHLWYGLRLFTNETNSAPRGVYIGASYDMDTFHLGDYVVMSLPYKVGFYEKGHLMLKQIKGFPSDEFDITDTHLEIRGLKYPINHTISVLPQMGRGHYAVQDYHYLLLNDPPDSFDSRYLGPIHRKYIVAKVRLLCTYRSMNDFLSHFSWILSKFK